ncbi:FAD-dependent oxidoreductase [Mucilaginibacter sp.]|uniref:FAD-dependent oxidoreductase n=1 Tax=Mucilaginibacter sp. TaxID=1882438 RepID=UPI003D0BE3F3
MLKKLILVLLVFNTSVIYAQTFKTDVLVIGGTASGTAAALQCAHSKVKTILVTDATELGAFPKTGMITIDESNNVNTGTWHEFRTRVLDMEKKPKSADTINNQLTFEPGMGASVLKSMTDTVKNLSIYLNTPFVSIKKDGDRWGVNFTQNGKTLTIKARVLIDATPNGDIAIQAGGKLPVAFDNFKDNGGLMLYRTSIAAGVAIPGQLYTDAQHPQNNYPQYPAYCIPISTVIVRDAENILITEKALPGEKSSDYLPIQLQLGQGVGTIAAYCAFFKTTTKNLNVRAIQGELLDFKGYLLPFADVSQKSQTWRAIQQVCATGLLRGKQKVYNGHAQFLFMPDSGVTTSEIKPVLTEIYTRAFLWFNKEKPGEAFTVGNTVSLISDYTLTDPQVLQKTLQQNWKTKYKFTLAFDTNRPVTRLEFTLLMNQFLNPFVRTVDLSGRLVN